MFKFERLIIIFSLILLLSSCDNDDPTKPENDPPVLTKLQIADTLFFNVDDKNIVTVNCEDPDGLDDIDSVIYRIYKANNDVVEQGIMYNDGDFEAHGDIVPNNQTYSTRLDQSFSPDNYRIEVRAVDKSREYSNRLEKEFYAAEAVLNRSPVITEYQVDDTVYVDQVLPFLIQVEVNDPDSGDYITEVSFEIKNHNFTEIVEQGALVDDGTSGDAVAGDGIYSIETNSSFATWEFDFFHLFITARDNNQNMSDVFYKLISPAKVNAGVPPQISDLAAPDTFKLPGSGADSTVLSIKAIDPDNNKDIKNVLFNTYRPDGTITSSSPLYMYDDGNQQGYSGDAVAGDNVYSIEIYLPYNTTPGNYRFEFEAIDYSNLISDKIIHTITVNQ